MSQWDEEKPRNKREQYTDPNDFLTQNERTVQQINLNPQPVRRGCGCGCIFGLLAVLSFIGIFVFAFGIAFFPEGAKAASPLFCPTNSTMRSIEGETDADGTEMFFHCFDAENRLVEDVTWKFVVAMIGITFLPFIFVGLAAFSASRNALRVARAYIPLAGNNAVWTNTGGGTVSINTQTIDLRDKMRRGELNQADIDKVTGVFNQFFGNDASSASTGNATERLRELQEAYDAGLVTKEEYDRKRAEILNNL